MPQSEKIDLLAKAMIEVQKELQGAKKSAENPFYKSNYADLQACIEAGAPVLTKHGLCVLQPMGGTPDSPSVITLLMHESGQWVSGELVMTPDKKGPQGIGSAITYNRRYSYSAMIGLHQEDDDGEGTKNKDKKESGDKSTTKETPKSKGIHSSPITDKDATELFKLAQGKGMVEGELHTYCQEKYNVQGVYDLTKKQYIAALKDISSMESVAGGSDDIPF